MCQRSIQLAVLLVSLFTFSIAHGQTPDAAINYFEHGYKKVDKGDLDGAIADYTRAILISSRLGSGPDSLKRSLLDSKLNSEWDSVSVVDPFTANAYNNRGAAFYKKGDLDLVQRDEPKEICLAPLKT